MSDDYILTKTVDSKINVVDSRAEVLKEDLNQTEKKAFEIIKNISNNGLISRYALEGNLLYGDLKLGNIPMYHLIIELENKGLIKKIQMKDGEYPTFITIFSTFNLHITVFLIFGFILSINMYNIRYLIVFFWFKEFLGL